MENEIFKKLILDAYKKSSKGNLVGILYNAVSTYGFSDMKDIDGFVKNCNTDMLYLKSKLTGNESVGFVLWHRKYFPFPCKSCKESYRCGNCS